MVSINLFSRKKKTPAPPPSLAPRAPPPIPVQPPKSKLASYTSIINQYEELSSLGLSASLVPEAIAAVSAARAQAHTPDTAGAGPTRPPRLNTSQGVMSAPSSPVSRKLGLESRHLPASFVRHSRVLSSSSANFGALDAMFLPAASLRQRLRTIQSDLPPELLPVINLLNAQRLRQYAAGPLSIAVAASSDWLECDAVLLGTELCIFVEGSSKARYLNVQDCTIVPSRTAVPGDDLLYDLVVLLDFDTNITTLRFPDVDAMVSWVSGLHLAKFENTSLNEAFTAVMLSLKGPELLDIYTLLAHKKRFPRFEWCNLRLPQVLSKWVRVYMAIMPGVGKQKGRIEVYALDKINKKSLVLYVNDATAVYNVYPEDHTMINFNSIMKLEGEVFVNKQFEQLFSHASGGPNAGAAPTKVRSRTTSLTSLNSLNPPAALGVPASPGNGNRSRSTSINSTNSFFNNAPLPDPEGLLSLPSSPTRATSQHFFKKQSASNFASTNYLYVMPLPHPGVSALEIMIRNFVHIIDAFKLYGRPDHLNSDKRNIVSMLFGMPSLPHCCYLSDEDAYEVVAANFDTARLNNWRELEWRTCLKEYLECKQRDTGYKGSGNIGELFNKIDSDSSSILEDGLWSPRIDLPQYGSRVTSPQPPPVPSKLRESSSEVGRAGESLNDSIYLGRPIDLDDRARSPRLVMDEQLPTQYLTNEEVYKSLEPIVDLPTPMDELPGKHHYFGVYDDQAVPVAR